jgi:hypothetical protein
MGLISFKNPIRKNNCASRWTSYSRCHREGALSFHSAKRED